MAAKPYLNGIFLTTKSAANGHLAMKSALNGSLASQSATKNSLASQSASKSSLACKTGPKSSLAIQSVIKNALASKSAPKKSLASQSVPNGPSSADLKAILAFFQKTYPNAKCGLDFKNPYELLMATILSAQCTDKTVNVATKKLFERFPDIYSLAAADLALVEDSVKICGFFRQKALSLVASAQDIVARFGGAVPKTLEELVTLKGVGRKTANVVLGEAFGIPGLTIDTHVKRISLRLKLSLSQSPDQIELDLMALIPKELWLDFSRQVIAHGRTLCLARKPLCVNCSLMVCPTRAADFSLPSF